MKEILDASERPMDRWSIVQDIKEKRDDKEGPRHNIGKVNETKDRRFPNPRDQELFWPIILQIKEVVPPLFYHAKGLGIYK